MKQDEIIIGKKYLFLNNGNIEHKKEFNNKTGIVIKRIKGSSDKKAYFRNKRGKKPDKFLLDIGVYANAANLKEIVVSDTLT